MIKDPIEPSAISNSPTQTLSDLLDRLEISASRIGQLSSEQAFELLVGLDSAYQRMQALSPDSSSRKTADAQLKDIQSKIKKEAGRFIRDLGGAQVLQQRRAEVNPPQDREWWFLDQWLARKRQAALKRTLITGGVMVVLIAILAVLYNRFLAPDPRDVAIYSHQQSATQRMQEADFESALQEVNQGLQIAPQAPELLVLKGIAQEQLGQSAQAAVSFEAAQKGFEQREEFWLVRGQAYLMANLPEKAFADAQAALQANPQSASAYLLRGQVEEVQKKYQDAIDDYNLAYAAANQSRQTELAAIARVRIAYLTQSMGAQSLPEQGITPTPAQ